jgi:putative ABC transport system permease protein
MKSFFPEVARTVRGLMLSPAFTTMVVFALVLGIGANAAVFSVVNAILLRPLPYPEAERLVRIEGAEPARDLTGLDVSYPDFADLGNQTTSFKGMATVSLSSFSLGTGAEPILVSGARVSASLFKVVGMRPLLGRVLLLGDDDSRGDRSVVLSYGLWHRAFGADPGVVGRVVQLDGQPYVVVGVLAEFSEFPDRADLWVPLDIQPSATRREDRDYMVIARLGTGRSIEAAGQQLVEVSRRLASEYPQTNRGFSLEVTSLREARIGRYRPLLAILSGVVAFVLLLACANVANLFLQRAVVREREMAVRLALGAGRTSLVRLLMLESILLALLGGVLGLVFARWLLGWVAISIPFALPAFIRFDLSLTVLGFTLLISIFVAVFLGWLPAALLARGKRVNSLWGNGLRTAGSPRRRRLRSSLVMAQVALALVLLIGATLMVRSFQRLQAVDPGFDSSHGLAIEVPLPASQYPQPAQRADFYQAAAERLASLPGVTSVAAASHAPLQGAVYSKLTVDEQPEASGESDGPSVGVHLVDGPYLRTIGLPVLRGRDLGPFDREAATRVAVISQRMADSLWPGQNAVGKQFRLDLSGDDIRWMVVGVTRDIRYRLNRPPRNEIYLPYRQLPTGSMVLLLNTSVPPAGVAVAARREIRSLNSNLAIGEVQTFEQIVEASIWYQRVSSWLLTLFAVLALGLALMGTYGAMAYSVAQRTRELGIRMALGAQRFDMQRLVLREGIKVAAFGVGIGLVGAFLLSRALRSLLFEVKSTDPVTFVGTALLLLVIAAVASWIPALRASQIDPVQALRFE